MNCLLNFLFTRLIISMLIFVLTELFNGHYTKIFFFVVVSFSFLLLFLFEINHCNCIFSSITRYCVLFLKFFLCFLIFYLSVDWLGTGQICTKDTFEQRMFLHEALMHGHFCTKGYFWMKTQNENWKNKIKCKQKKPKT